MWARDAGEGFRWGGRRKLDWFLVGRVHGVACGSCPLRGFCRVSCVDVVVKSVGIDA